MPAYHIMREGKYLTVCIAVYEKYEDVVKAMRRIKEDRIDYKARRYFVTGPTYIEEVVR